MLRNIVNMQNPDINKKKFFLLLTETQLGKCLGKFSLEGAVC